MKTIELTETLKLTTASDEPLIIDMITKTDGRVYDLAITNKSTDDRVSIYGIEDSEIEAIIDFLRNHMALAESRRHFIKRKLEVSDD